MVTKEQIDELRNSFLQELTIKGNDAVHPKDYERVKRDDMWLKRFLMHHDQNQKDALNMLWETLNWRKEFKANEINENVKMDLICQGGFFPHGRDKDGCCLFIFKCKKYVKGTNHMDEMKKCVIYWFERLERQEKGQPITLFFDMEGCGLSNMDMEFTKYLIGLFKLYYPYFLNYILIFEMPWVLSAAFKIIKSWLPEKAVQKIKQIGKKDIKEFVAPDQALVCWGGQDNYVFNFMPEVDEPMIGESPSATNNRKVHFADGSSMSETGAGNSDKEQHDGGVLVVHPSTVISFIQERGELVSTLELENGDSTIILAYKLKTTSPEKFRVRPSVGCLIPGAKTTVHVTLLPGFQLGGLSRDKFLLMSTPLEPNEVSLDFATLWKDTTGRKVYQHRLKCVQANEITKNGNAVAFSGTSENDQNNINQLAANINKLIECQGELHLAVKRTHYYQFVLFIFVLLLGVALAYIIKIGMNFDINNEYCRKADEI